MKTLVFEFNDPTAGDLIIVNVESPRGGKTSVKHKVLGQRLNPVLDADGNMVSTTVVPADTSASIAIALALQVNKDWMPECANATAKGSQLVIKCTDLFDGNTFTTEIHGGGKTTISAVEY